MFKLHELLQLLNDYFINNKKTSFILTALSILFAAGVWFGARAYYEGVAEEKFELTVNEYMESIGKHMAKYENILLSGIGFFHGSEHVSHAEWHDFIKAIDIKKNYPGMQGVGFSKMLKPQEVATTEQQMRDEGFESFSINPKGEREIYSSILYLEPMDKRNLAAIGYDMFSEPVRREAMQRARDTGEPAISGKVTLLQEIDEDTQPGILMYLPLYKKGLKTNSVEDRRNALDGFVYSPFRMRDLIDKILLRSSVLEFEIYDGNNVSDSALLYRTPQYDSYATSFHTIKKLNVNGREWLVHFCSTKEFDKEVSQIYPLLIALAGVVIQLFLLLTILALLKNKTLLKLQAAELTKLSQALEQSSSTVVITDLEGNIEYANEAFTETTGYSKEEAIGQNPRILQSGHTPAETYDQMWKCLTSGNAWRGEFINKTKSGEEYIEDVKISPIFQLDGTISNYLAIKEDITERKEVEKRTHYLANYDALTGLANRFLLDEQLKYIISEAKRNESTFSVIFLDLDHFKEINDILGHDAGDTLLIEMARRFKHVLREVDTIARLGGDEFIFILPGTGIEGASQAAQKLLDAIEKPLVFKENELLVSGSIGIAVYPLHGKDKESLFKNADDAMYLAKHEGRNTYRVYGSETQPMKDFMS